MSRQFGKIAVVKRFASVAGATLVVALLLLAGSLLTYQPTRAQGPNDPRRAFYLTPLTYDGSQALNACVAGFHMASLWEILDPSNLRYDTTLGFTREDSGSGPPVAFGWVRTGSFNNTLGGPGAGNCNAWTSNSPAHRGSAVHLTNGWGAGAPTHVSPWQPLVRECVFTRRVWCMED